MFIQEAARGEHQEIVGGQLSMLVLRGEAGYRARDELRVLLYQVSRA